MKHAYVLVTLLAATMAGSVAGCAGGKMEEAAISSPAVQSDLLTRWNAAAEEHSTANYDFHWPVFPQFPHPTFKMGTEEAYATFQTVLLAFLEDEDNFQFLQHQRLFDAPLPHEFENHCCDTSWTFRGLVGDFAGADTLGGDSETRRRFQLLEKQIDAAG